MLYFRCNDSNRTLHSSQLHRSVQSTTFLSSPLLRSDLLPAVSVLFQATRLS